MYGTADLQCSISFSYTLQTISKNFSSSNSCFIIYGQSEIKKSLSLLKVSHPLVKVERGKICMSCWTFIEGVQAVKSGKLESYSEQELLDCDTVDNACNGGLPDDAYKAIEKIGGLELEDDYPYEAKKAKQCRFNQTMSHVKVKGAVDLPKDEVSMQKWLITNGPISIGNSLNFLLSFVI